MEPKSRSRCGAVQDAVKLDPTQVSGKKMEPAPASQAVGRDSTASMRRELLNLDWDMDSFHQLGDEQSRHDDEAICNIFRQLKKNYCYRQGRGIAQV